MKNKNPKYSMLETSTIDFDSKIEKLITRSLLHQGQRITSENNLSIIFLSINVSKKKIYLLQKYQYFPQKKRQLISYRQ